MRKLSIFIAALLIVVIAGGVVFIAQWDIPAPSRTVEKVIPDDKLPR